MQSRIKKSCAYALMVLLLTLALPLTAKATTVTISTTTRQWPYGGTVATARVYADQSFFTSDGEQVIGGTVGSSAWYKIVNCTISGTTLTIPSFTLPSTTNSTDRPTARWSIVFYDQNGVRRDTWMPTFMLPPGPTPTTWTAIRNYNNAVVVRPPDNAYYTRTQADANLAALVTGSNAAPMTDVIRGTAKLFEPAADAANPIVVTPKSVFINSSRIQTTASLPAASVLEGTTTKVSDGFRGQVYDNGTTTTRANLGVFNIKDFGAKPTAGFNNRSAIQAAITAASAAGGGTVLIPDDGVGSQCYEVNTTLFMASYVTFAGVSSNGGIGGKSCIKLTAGSQSVITIGESLFNVKIKDLTLATAIAKGGGTLTYGIKATGASPTATQNVQIENVATDGFDRGIAALATDIGKEWQFSYVTLSNYVSQNCTYALYLDAINSDWHISDMVTYAPQDGWGIYCNNCGSIQYDHSNPLGGTPGAACSGGTPNPAFGEAFMHIQGAHGAIVVINAQAEGYRKNLVMNNADYAYPISWIGSVTGAAIDLNAQVHFTLQGSNIYDNTITASNGAKVYMIGNSIDSRNTCLDAGTGIGGVTVSGASSAVTFRTALDGTDFGRPVSIGSVRPDTTDPTTQPVPWLRIGRPVSDQILVRMGTTDAAGVFTNYYDLKRNGTTGFFDILGSQSGSRGLAINGPMEFATVASAGTPASGQIRVNWTGTAFQIITPSTTKTFLNSATVYAAGAIPAMVGDGSGAATASPLLVAGGNVTMPTGSLALDSATGQIVSNATTGTAPFTVLSTTKVTNFNSDTLDGLDWRAPGTIGGVTPGIGNFTSGSFTGTLTGVAGTFSGAVSGTSGTFSTTVGITGVTTPTGGIAAAGGFSFSPRLVASCGTPAITATQGTDTTPVNTETYIVEVFIPANATVTGVALLNGTAVAGNVKISLATSAGAPIAGAITASTAQAGTAVYQLIPFAVAYAAKGPATYYILIQFDTNATPRFRSHTFAGVCGASKKTGEVYGTFTTVTAPSTFTASLGPVASLY